MLPGCSCDDSHCETCHPEWNPNTRNLTERQKEILALIGQHGMASFARSGRRGRFIVVSMPYGVHITAYTYPQVFLVRRGLIDVVGDFDPARYRLTRKLRSGEVTP